MLRHSARLLPLAVLFASPALGQVSVKSIADTCIGDGLKDCTVASAGFVAPRDTPRIAWQVQTGQADYGGLGGGLVVLVEQDGRWQELTADYSGAYYELPQLSEAEPVLFHVPGFTAGTGSFNADLLFEFAPDQQAWRPVDMESWWQDIEAMLPEGLAIWKGVRYSFGQWSWGDMRARTALWRDEDGNCCPTGGEAIIHFTLEDARLVVDTVDYTPPEPEDRD